MFTGIVEAVGEIAALQPRGGDLRLRVRSGALDMTGVKLGDSIATNGVCLTVVELTGDGYWADVSRETLSLSSFASAQVGQRVNLEKAMAAGSRFDGHIVSGHVDGMATVLRRQDDARSLRLTLQAPAELAKYIATKGSICVDGVSLTVNRVDGSQFELNIVPHTAQQTIITGYAAGTEVNIEVDVIARYLERLLTSSVNGGQGGGERGSSEQKTATLSAAFLAEHGFIKAR